MTEHQNINSQSASATYASLMNALDGLHNGREVGDRLREFAKRSAAIAKNGGADLHAGATKATATVENALVKAVGEIADANRTVLNAAYQEVEAACTAFDTLAGAKSFEEAYKVYADYLRQRGEVGVARAKNVAGFASAKASEAFEALRDGAAKVLPTRVQAA